MLTEVNTSFPPNRKGDARAFIRRSAARLASLGSLISSSRTVNSSPPRRATVKVSPKRATVSVDRRHFSSRLEKCLRSTDTVARLRSEEHTSELQSRFDLV